jgi:hypothetical protein
MNSSVITLSPQQLRRAADLKERIDSLQGELLRVLGSSAPASLGAAPPQKKRTLSKAAIARIRAGAKARWARIRASNNRAGAARLPKKRMSAAAKARLSAIARERWRKAKASGRHAL